jgi:hypothetical protein
MFSRTSICLLSISFALAGCAHEDATYQPMAMAPMPATTWTPPQASSYGIPADAPKGSVHVMSLGTEHLAVAAGQPDTFLHLRVAIENAQDTVPWTASAGEQVLTGLAGATGTMAEGGFARPAFAQSSAAGPVLTVPPGGRGYLDLFYAMPGGQPPSIDLDWRIDRGNDTVAQITRFERAGTAQGSTVVAYQPVVYQPGFGMGFYLGVGPSWWYDGWGWMGGSYGWYRPRHFAPAPLSLHARAPVHVSGRMGGFHGRR